MGRKGLNDLRTHAGRRSCYEAHAVTTGRATSFPTSSLPLCRDEDIGNGRNMVQSVMEKVRVGARPGQWMGMKHCQA